MDNEFTAEDLQQNSTKAALGYIVFFLPLILCKGSRVGRYCANQGLLLTVCSLLCGILAGIPLLGWIFRIISGLACLGLFIVGLLCYIQMMTSKRVVQLPYIGGFRLIP